MWLLRLLFLRIGGRFFILFKGVVDYRLEIVQGSLEIVLVRLKSIIVDEITAHPPDFAQFFVWLPGKGFEPVSVHDRFVHVVVVHIVLGIGVEGCTLGQCLEDGVNYDRILDCGDVESSVCTYVSSDLVG